MKFDVIAPPSLVLKLGACQQEISTAEMVGSRKRRKLSPQGEDSEEDESRRPIPSLPMMTISRINPRVNGTATHGSTGLIPPKSKGNFDDSTLIAEKTSFATLDVAPWLVASLSAMAITKPTGIQKGCIQEILSGKDVIGGSRTGSGKTIAFAVPILQKWAEDPVGIFAVVLTPTRRVTPNPRRHCTPNPLIAHPENSPFRSSSSSKPSQLPNPSNPSS